MPAGDTVLVSEAGIGGYGFPAWSPDGKHLATTRVDDTGRAIVIIDSTPQAAQPAANVVIFESTTAQPFYLSWRPDSEMVSFLAQETDGLSLRIAPVDASAPLDGIRSRRHHPHRQPVLLRLDRLGPAAGAHRIRAGGIPRRGRARRRRAGWRARSAGRVPLAGHQPRRRATWASFGQARPAPAARSAPHRSSSRTATATTPHRCR